MKKRLFVPLVLTLVILTDVLYRFIGDYTFKIEHESRRYGFAYQNFSQKADLVIIGSSRAKHHYDCNMIKDSLNVETYNLGCDAYGILQQYLVLLRLIDNKGTSTVIFDITHKTLIDAFGWSDNNELNFVPYYWANDTLKYYMDKQYGKFHNLRYLSSLIQYNGKVRDVLYNFYYRNKDHDKWENKDYGYSPIAFTGKANTDFRSDNIIEFTPSPLCLQLLDNIVALSKKNGIRLILTISPVVDDWSQFSGFLKNYALQKNVEFYDFSQCDGITDNMYYFKDYHHLNAHGAKALTNKVITVLEENY